MSSQRDVEAAWQDVAKDPGTISGTAMERMIGEKRLSLVS